MKRTVLIILVATFLSSTTLGQKALVVINKVNGLEYTLQPGMQARVIHSNGDRFKGRVNQILSDSIVVEADTIALKDAAMIAFNTTALWDKILSGAVSGFNWFMAFRRFDGYNRFESLVLLPVASTIGPTTYFMYSLAHKRKFFQSDLVSFTIQDTKTVKSKQLKK